MATKQVSRLDRLEKEVVSLRRQVGELQSRQYTILPLTTLEPEPYQLLRPLQVVLKPDGDGIIASVLDDLIIASGETLEEAMYNLKDMMMAFYDSLMKEKHRLAKRPAAQLRALRSVMKKKS